MKIYWFSACGLSIHPVDFNHQREQPQPQQTKNTTTMKNFNKKLTKSEGKQLLSHKGGISYMDTPHNRKLMKSLMTDFLKTLAANK